MNRQALLQVPGGRLLIEGIDDVLAGRRTVNAYLVAALNPQLEALGLLTRADVAPLRTPDGFEIEAYRLLAAREGLGAHARFNALMRELDSGLAILEREARRGATG